MTVTTREVEVTIPTYETIVELPAGTSMEEIETSMEQEAPNIFRVLISRIDGGVPDLAKCTATRTQYPDGKLLEVVRVDGSAELLDRDKLDEWLRGIPVKTPEECRWRKPKG